MYTCMCTCICSCIYGPDSVNAFSYMGPGRLPCNCLFEWFQMNVGVAHSEVNPNTRVMNSRGIWLSYLLLTVVLHVVLLSIPFITVPLVWTLTNVIHNLVRAALQREMFCKQFEQCTFLRT